MVSCLPGSIASERKCAVGCTHFDARNREKLRYNEENVMLVLSRKKGESVKIGDGITVTILECTKGRTKVGIDAPQDLRIARTELPPLESQEVQSGNDSAKPSKALV